MKEIASDFQFDEATMELLRKGDKAAQETVARRILAYFDALTRHVLRKTNCALDWHDCMDVAQDFIVQFFSGKLARYEDRSAKEFSKIFYTSLDNFAKDRIDQIVNSRVGTANQRRLEEPLPGGESTFGDMLPDKSAPEQRLLPSEFQELLADIRQAMLVHVKGDAMKAWVLEASLAKEMKAEEISKAVPKLFPGKVFAAGSVYGLVSHFRNGPELAGVAQKWMLGEAWGRMR